MENTLIDRKIYILGCTEIASALIRDVNGHVIIAAVLDYSGQYTEELFCGYPVYSYAKRKNSIDGLIVDCTNPYYERSFVEQNLIFDGFNVYTDYIDYVCFRALVIDKKVMIISGFCHTDDIFRGLVLLPKVTDDYQIYNFSYDVDNMTKYSSIILNRLIKLCKVYIYNQNAGNQLSFMREDLPDDCIRICIPVVRFYGIWPQINHNHNHYENIYYMKPDGYYDGAFIGGDQEINRRIDQGEDWRDIFSQISSLTFYSPEHVNQILEQSFRQMEFSERNSDIRIVEFIRSNYTEKRLFKDYRHIDNPIVFEYIRQISCLLGLDMSTDYITRHITTDLHTYTEMPVYPSVAKILGLKWVSPQSTYCIRSYNGEKHVSFQEYVCWYTAYSKAVREMKAQW